MNEKLFEILDNMFPGEFEFEHRTSIIRGKLKGEFLDPENTSDYPNSLADSFWLAEKVGLFDSYTFHKRSQEYVIINIDELVATDHFNVFCGDTPQDAIINAIISIYGDKNDYT